MDITKAIGFNISGFFRLMGIVSKIPLTEYFLDLCNIAEVICRSYCGRIDMCMYRNNPYEIGMCKNEMCMWSFYMNIFVHRFYKLYIRVCAALHALFVNQIFFQGRHYIAFCI